MADATTGEGITLTVPRQVLAAAGAAPSDRGQFEVIGPDRIRITVAQRPVEPERVAKWVGRADDSGSARSRDPSGRSRAHV